MPTVDIDPQGDVVLVCGPQDGGDDNRTSIRVCSSTLRLCSPVFAAMLRPEFKEGKQLASDGALEVPLPDDNVDAMTIICKILHLRHEKVPRRLNTTQLYEVAVLADKYQCNAALGPIAEHWCLELQKEDDDATRITLFLFAYVMRLSSMFKATGKDIILKATGPIAARVAGDTMANGPAARELQIIFDALTEQRHTVRTELASFIEGRIEQYCALNAKYACTHFCDYAWTYASKFLQQLKMAGMFPVVSFSQKKLSTSLAVMKETQWQLSTPQEINGRSCCGGYNSNCFMRRTDGNGADTDARIGQLFQKRAQDSEDGIRSLCLGCVLDGHDFKQSTCQHEQSSLENFSI